MLTTDSDEINIALSPAVEYSQMSCTVQEPLPSVTFRSLDNNQHEADRYC